MSSHNHGFDEVCRPSCDLYGMAPTNPDPINRPMPTYADRVPMGSNFDPNRGRPAPSRPAQEMLANVRRGMDAVKQAGISQADMGPMPEPPEEAVLASTVAGRVTPPRQFEPPDGPNYAGEEPEPDDSFWIRLSYPADTIPDRTQYILQNHVPTALRSFIRQNLQYGNTDAALGYRGQFADIYHITATLKRLMWDSDFSGMATSVAVGEIQEQLESLIGHALLALDHLETGNKHGK